MLFVWENAYAVMHIQCLYMQRKNRGHHDAYTGYLSRKITRFFSLHFLFFNKKKLFITKCFKYMTLKEIGWNYVSSYLWKWE